MFQAFLLCRREKAAAAVQQLEARGKSGSSWDPGQVTDFLSRHDIAADVGAALRKLPLERQREVVAADLTGANKPSAVLLSRIKRATKDRKPRQRRDNVAAFLRNNTFDEESGTGEGSRL